MVDKFQADKMIQHVMLTNHLPLTLRPASPKDAEPVLAYLEQVAGESENLSAGPGEFGISLEQERVFLQQAQDLPTNLYLLAEIEGEIVGTLIFSAEKRPRVQHRGEFSTSVLRKYWNQGIGGRMLAYLVDWARQTHVIRKINLRVHVDNLPAIRLYEKYGFVREGHETRASYLHGQFVDVFLMGLQLDPN